MGRQIFSYETHCLRDCINRVPRPAKGKSPLGRPPASTGDQWFGQRQAAEALSRDSISVLAENGFVRQARHPD